MEVLRGVEQAFGITLLEGYGLSETSPVASFNHPDRPTKPGSVGTPLRGVEFGLRDEDDAEVGEDEIGEIVIRGENVMKGYWNRPDATAEAMRGGWFHTGDLARRDADGFYFIVDRKKDMIIRNGFNVYPREVEEVLYTHPAVAEAAVFGVPDAAHGEEIAALITLKDGRGGHRAGAAGVRPGADRGVQVPPDRPLRPDPQGPDGQDPEARDQVRRLSPPSSLHTHRCTRRSTSHEAVLGRVASRSDCPADGARRASAWA